jgi:hypothetical protein
MTYEIIDNFLEKEDSEHIIKTFFPENLNNPNNSTWTYQKGIVRDPDLGSTGYEEYIDRKVPHKVALFYVTTFNGFTVLKDTAEVECVENRMLIFDGSI